MIDSVCTHLASPVHLSKVDYISHQPQFLDPSGQRAEAIVTVSKSVFLTDGEHSEKIYILS